MQNNLDASSVRAHDFAIVGVVVVAYKDSPLDMKWKFDFLDLGIARKSYILSERRLRIFLTAFPFTSFRSFICCSQCSCQCSISKYVESCHHARRIYLAPSAQSTSYLANLAQMRLHGNNFHFDISIDVFTCIRSICFIPFSFCSFSLAAIATQI